MIKRIDIDNLHHKFSDGLEFKPDIGRIRTLGEVFTSWAVVKKMLYDLRFNHSNSYDTIFEPASGHGNFGIEILKYKLDRVLKEMKKDNVSESSWTKEYEIRSLIALASLYQNDIDEQNIEELRKRLYRFIINKYKKNSRNLTNEIPTYYDFAVSNILMSNCIKSDIISSNNTNIDFIFYFRWKDWIYRIHKKMFDIQNEDKVIFDKELKQFDKVKFNEWNIFNFKGDTYMKTKINNAETREREREKHIYNQIKNEINKKFGINDKSSFKFTYCISNPPYQIETGGKNHNIYDKFWFLATNISRNVSMIFPRGWQTSSGRASGSAKHYLIREDKRILSVDNYYENKKKNQLILFETASTGGVNIVIWKENHDNNGFVDYYEYGIFKYKKNLLETHVLEQNTAKIFSKIRTYYKKFMIDLITGRNPCGILTWFMDPKRQPYSYLCFTEEKNLIKFWGNDGKDNKRKWMWLPKEFLVETEKKKKIVKQINKIKISQNNVNKWKVIWPKSGAWANWRDNKILEPNEYFSDTFICCYFSSKKQCENFISYFKTYFYRFCETETATDHNAVRIVHKNVPDLSNIKNPRTGKIGWDSDWTNDDLKKVFTFINDDEWKYIKEKALASDGGRE